MKPVKVKGIFSEEDLEVLNDMYENAAESYYQDIDTNLFLGRRSVGGMDPPDCVKKIVKLAEKFNDKGLTMRAWNFAEYNSIYGQPHLVPHWDGDDTELLINFQLSSNTEWGVGVDEKLFILEDNSAVVFNPNGSPHWRPIKEFKDGQYVRMIFFRFYNEDNPADHSYLPRDYRDPVFDKINDIRNNL
jgi:hypothetical protein